MGVSDRSLHAQLTQQAKIPTNSLFFAGIFAFADFIGSLKERIRTDAFLSCKSGAIRGQWLRTAAGIGE